MAATHNSNAPRPYDLSDPAEMKRLFGECHGYLRTCHHKHGTDWEGRQFAIDALAILSERATPKQVGGQT